MAENRTNERTPLARDERHTSARVWHGTKGDLEEVLTVVKKLRAEAVESLQTELNEAKAVRDRSHREATEQIKALMAPPARVTFVDDDAQDLFDASLSELVKNATPFVGQRLKAEEAERRIDDISMRIYDLRKSGSGTENDADEVLPMVHPGKTRDLEIKFGNVVSDPYLSVKFERLGGVKVTAASANTTWVTGTLSRIDALLSQRTPPYAFLARWWVGIPLCFMIAITGSAQLAHWLQIPPSTTWFWGAGFWGVLGILFVLWTTWLFPKFELYKSGGQPTAKAITGAVLVVAPLIPWAQLSRALGQ